MITRRAFNLSSGLNTATLAPSSHNTQCWKFRIEEDAIMIIPDFKRRCLAVDPDDRYLYVSLKCVTENLVQAALAYDGLYSVISGNPNIPTWLGTLIYNFVLTPQTENEKFIKNVRSAAGITIFWSEKNDQVHWLEVGRYYQSFALQATTMEIRNSMLNQPVEVATVRPRFANYLGLRGRRPDLVVRFGRGKEAPRSLGRTISTVIV